MKKKLIFVSLILLMISVLLSGCESNLRKKIEREKARTDISELDLDLCFSEDMGYHFSPIDWGMDMKEADQAIYHTIDKLLGIGPDDSMTYNISVVTKTVLDHLADQATIATDASGKVFMYSLMFDSSKLQESDMKFSEMFTKYLSILEEKFGEPTKHTTEDHEITQGTDATYDVYYFDYETPDGKVTEIQWSAAYMYHSDEPSYLSLGFVWLNPMKAEK